MAIWDRFFGQAVSTAAGYGMGSSLGPALEPVTQEVANETWAMFPLRPLPATIAAGLVAEGRLPLDEGRDEAAMTGYNAERFDRYVLAARQVPQLAQLLDLWRRGAIDEADVRQALGVNRFADKWVNAALALKRVLPPVTDLVRFGVREVYNPQQRAFLDLDAEFPDAILPDARQIGLGDQTTRDYWAAHWELPSYTQATQMLFRGELTREQFAALLKAQDYAPTWRDKLEAIARAIPSLTDMSRLAVREVYNPAQRRALDLDAEFPDEYARQAAKHGMSEDDARDLWAGHWRLPSARQGYQMLFRGEITDAELDGLLKALDYAPVWRDRVKAIAHLVPGRVDLRRMFRYNVIGRAEVKRGYQRLGYTAADAETLTKFAEAEKDAASVTDEDSHVARARSSLWTTTHRSYLAGELTKTLAVNKLAQVGVPVADREPIIALWDHERELSRKQLTPAQIKKAYAKVVKHPTTGEPWTRDDAITALVALGYSPSDAAEFLSIPPTRTAPEKSLTASQIRQALHEGDVNPATGAPWTIAEAVAALVVQGYTEADATTYLGLGA